MARQTLTVAQLEGKCETLEKHVLHRRLATPAEVDAYRVGGSENFGRGLAGWVFFYAQLVRFCGRADVAEAESGAQDAIVLDALRAEPMDVELVNGERLQVHPKGMDALLACHERDVLLGWLATRLELVVHVKTPEALALLERALGEVAYQYALLAWIVTTEGPALPYARSLERPEPPAAMRDLDPWDVVRLAQAHAVVNAQRLQAIEALLAPDRGEDDAGGSRRPSWSVFIGELSVKTQRSARELMRDHSLAELLATVKLHDGVEREAQARAEARVERDVAAKGGA